MSALDGSGLQRLTMSSAIDEEPAWSPDGSLIAFQSDRGGNFDIYVMDALGGSVKQITTSGGEDVAPSWSPDGSMIVFESGRDGDTEIFVIASDGSGVARQLTHNTSHDGDPAWGPTGVIAFLSDRGGRPKSDLNRPGFSGDSVH